MKYKLCPDYLNNEIEESNSNYTTRQKLNLKIAHTRTYTAEKSIVFKGFKWFNSLDKDLIDENITKICVIKLKEYIKRNVRYFDKL